MGAAYHAGDKITSGVAAPATGDSRLRALYDANPYRNAEYTVSPWNQFLSWLGFRTSADAWKENMAVQASEYDAQVAEMNFENEYNSPMAQLQREQAAGLNPNLNGGQSLDAGNTDGLPDDTNPPMVSQGDEPMIGRVVNGCLSAFSTALGIVQSIQGVTRNRLSNTLLDQEVTGSQLGLVGDVDELVGKMAPQLLPESPNPAGMLDKFDWRQDAMANAKRFVGNLPKKSQKQFLSQIESYWNSAYGNSKSYKEFQDRVKNRRGYFIESQTNYDEFDSVLEIISKPLAEAAEKIYKLDQKRTIKEDEAAIAGADAEIAGAKTEEAYQNALDGNLMGEAQNAENKVVKETDDSIAILRKSLDDMIQGLDRASQKPGFEGTMAQIAKVLIAALQMNFSSGLHPTISRSNSSGSGNSKSTSSSSISF